MIDFNIYEVEITTNEALLLLPTHEMAEAYSKDRVEHLFTERIKPIGEENSDNISPHKAYGNDHITMDTAKPFKMIINPVGHGINRCYASGKVVGIEHSFDYIDEKGKFRSINATNDHVRFIKKVL